MAKRFTDVTSSQAKKTLARRFVGLADQLRDMLTKFGLRAYKVSIIRIEWTGGKRGRGTPVVIYSKPILPTPKIAPIDGLSEIVSSIGLDEQGSLVLSQISGTFSEEELTGSAPDGTPIPVNQEFIYEVEFFPHEGPSRRRRFYPSSAPTYAAGGLQWTIRLDKVNEDRQRNGDPS